MAKSFKCFYLSGKSCEQICDAMDKPTRANTSDSEACQSCGSCLQFGFFPIFLTIDIISLPFRGIYYFAKK